MTEHVLWYRRPIPPIARDPDERLLLHVGAADFETMVWVNDVEVGSHRGGHTSFTFDITDALDDPGSEAELTMRVIDEFRADQVRGKQTTTFPYLVHYRPTSGIWLPVWIEVAGARWIRELHVTATDDDLFTPELRVQLPGGAAIGETRATLVAPKPRPGPPRAVTIPRLGIQAGVIVTAWEPPPFVVG